MLWTTTLPWAVGVGVPMWLALKPIALRIFHHDEQEQP